MDIFRDYSPNAEARDPVKPDVNYIPQPETLNLDMPLTPAAQCLQKPESSAPAVALADSCRAPPPEGHQCLG